MDGRIEEVVEAGDEDDEDVKGQGVVLDVEQELAIEVDQEDQELGRPGDEMTQGRDGVNAAASSQRT